MMSSRPENAADAAKAGPGRPKDLGKRAAILDAAKRLFTQTGFDGTSMDQIAAEAGVSKLTVYSHFGDKESLFSAAVRAKCEEQMPPTLFLSGLEGDLRAQLTAIAHAFLALITSEEAVAMHRMMMAPGTGDTNIRELFWQAGPQAVKDGLTEFLRARVARGELAIADLSAATSQFLCLVKGDLHMQLLYGMSCGATEMDIDRHVDATVELFLRGYAAERAG